MRAPLRGTRGTLPSPGAPEPAGAMRGRAGIRLAPSPPVPAPESPELPRVAAAARPSPRQGGPPAGPGQAAVVLKDSSRAEGSAAVSGSEPSRSRLGGAAPGFSGSGSWRGVEGTSRDREEGRRR